MAAESSSENLRIIVERNPSEARVSELNVQSWPKWGCGPGSYQLRYEAEETCYLLRGKVKVSYTYKKKKKKKKTPASPSSSNISNSDSDSDLESESVEFGAGDLVIIPKGLSCTWDVSVSVDKHYKFHSSS